jgi:hypothetical protein
VNASLGSDSPPAETQDCGQRPAYLPGLLVLAASFALVLALQLSTGAWRSDFGGHADEGAHVVTSLMLRDYLAGGWREQAHPVRYAEAYYGRFPKVAIGHYPPGFYLLAGLWLLPWRAPEALLLLMALVSAGAATAAWRLARDTLGPGPAPLFLALALCLMPLFRTYTAIVMSDSLLVLCALLAALAFLRFLRRRRLQDALAFGAWAAAAILVKGSGLCLALLPPLAIALAGRWPLLREPRLWVAPLPVLVFALPWMWATHGITAEGMAEAGPNSYFREASAFYFKGLAELLGWPALALLALSLLALLPLAAVRRRIPANEGACVALALALSVLLLALAVPSGLDLRYLLPLLPAALVAGAWGLRAAISAVRPGLASWAVPAFALLALVGASPLRPVEKRYTGAAELIDLVLAEDREANSGEGEVGETAPVVPAPARLPVLLVADATGEGALTAAAAFAGPERLRILRGSKLLATSDWLGRGYSPTFEGPDGFRELLRREGIRYAIVEDSGGREELPEHWVATERLLLGRGQDDNRLTVIESLRKRGTSRPLRLFRLDESLTAPPLPAAETAPPPPGAARAAPAP